MQRIKYVFLTTLSVSLDFFMMPVVTRLDKNTYDISLACNMADDFYGKYKREYHCIQLNLARGFHLVKTISCILKLVKEFKKIKPDIIEYGTENVSFCAAIAGWLTRVPVRVYNHWGARYIGLNGFSRFLSKNIERIAGLFSTDIRQQSPRNMQMCIEEHIYSARKVKVLGLGGSVGVDSSVFDVNKKEKYRKEIRDQFCITKSDFVFGFVGRIQAEKGINELLCAFKDIYQSNSEMYLMLVGNTEYTQTLHKDLYNWALDCPNVIFTGAVSDVYRYMSAFDVMVHPSYREGFGMVLQEAGALKTPIITTDILGPSEFITNKENGILVSPQNSEELKRAMLFLTKNPDFRQEISENLYEHTMNYFERKIMVDRIIKDRESLLKEMKKYD